VYGCQAHINCTIIFLCKFSSVFYCLGANVANATLRVCKTSANATAVAS
jgi:hypothetical protein